MQGRAVQEVVTMRTLRHPHVLPVLAHFQVGFLPAGPLLLLHAQHRLQRLFTQGPCSLCTQDDGHIWLVLPFVNGGSAESIISERHPQVASERL